MDEFDDIDSGTSTIEDTNNGQQDNVEISTLPEIKVTEGEGGENKVPAPPPKSKPYIPKPPGPKSPEPKPPIPRPESIPDLHNLTIHQCARNDDIRSAEALISGKENVVSSTDKEYRRTPMHFAARHNNLKMLKLLRRHNADISAVDKDGLTPLHYAAKFKREGDQEYFVMDSGPHDGLDELFAFKGKQPPSKNTTEDIASAISYLIGEGADINSKDNYGQTPLHYAAMKGNAMACKELLGFKDIFVGFDIDAKDNQEMTPLHIAASRSHLFIVKLLIEHGAKLRCRDTDDMTPFHAACTEGNIDIVTMFFDKGNDQENLEMVKDRDCTGNTCLSLAVKNGHYDVAELCLKKGADVSARNNSYMYPLHLAAVKGDVNIVRLLINNKAKIDVLNNELATPLHIACRYNRTLAVQLLLDKGADKERRDSENYTPLLLATVYGHSATIDRLLQKGADIKAVEENDRTAVFLAAEENQLLSLEALLKYEKTREMINVSDKNGNDPLHIAAEKGNIQVVKILLVNGANVDSKNTKDQTPLHLAAKNGKTSVVRELVDQPKNTINGEDEASNTALHLAALAGHTKVAEVLIEMGADVSARNKSLRTPLDCASAGGWLDTVRVLLDADSPLNATENVQTTPLHLAAANGHMTVVELLIDWDAVVEQRDSSGNNCLDLAIDNNNRQAAVSIINSNFWQEALRNTTGEHDTPMRKLIRNMPDVAEMVFSKCLEDDVENGEITFNYEFLDDLFSIPYWKETENDNNSVFDENNHVKENAVPYTSDSKTFKTNHPLNIMVSSKREALLDHPLVTSLLRHKWRSFGKIFYYVNFIIFAFFLLFITGYIASTTPPYIKNPDVEALSTNQSYCEKLEASGYNQPGFAKAAKYFIIILVVLQILIEGFQVYQAHLNYLSWENLIEWVLYICSLLCVIDSSDCQTQTGYRYTWQWNAGTIAIFLSWINLLLFIQKFPRFGIYVVMFKYYLKTFLRFFLVFLLFIIAFAFAFHAMMQNQKPFETEWQSIIKTTAMMLGELDYGSTYTEGELAVEWLSYIAICVFFVVMNIIIMNLMVGLAVDDIQGVQAQAQLTRKTMQVELALDVEKIVPASFRRKIVTRKETVSRSNTSIFVKIKQHLGMESYTVTESDISKALNPEMSEIQQLQGDVDNLKGVLSNNQKEMETKISNLEGMVQNRMNNLELMLKTLMAAQKVDWVDEASQETEDIGSMG